MGKQIRSGKTMQMLNIVLLHNQQPESYIGLFERLLQEDYVVKLTGESYIELISFKKRTLHSFKYTALESSQAIVF